MHVLLLRLRHKLLLLLLLELLRWLCGGRLCGLRHELLRCLLYVLGLRGGCLLLLWGWLDVLLLRWRLRELLLREPVLCTVIRVHFQDLLQRWRLLTARRQSVPLLVIIRLHLLFLQHLLLLQLQLTVHTPPVFL